jgi:hypothetical protein
MDSPHHFYSAGNLMECGRALSPPITPATELDLSLLELPLASQRLSVLHPVFPGFSGAVLLSHCTLPGSRLTTQGTIHTSESLERQSCGSHSHLLSPGVPVSTFLCCHHPKY